MQLLGMTRAAGVAVPGATHEKIATVKVALIQTIGSENEVSGTWYKNDGRQH